MNTVAIICEYNPFHNGHKYQIDKIREMIPDARILCLMSGDFAQRGAPAITDKYARTQMALSGGADIVLELPSIWATSSAYDFANGGVHILNSLGCIDHLAFGCETEDFEALIKIAAILADEPATYRDSLKEALSLGQSFPSARETALQKELSEDISELISRPNNLLALEYLRSLKETGSNIKPLFIRRHESEHSSLEISGTLASGTAIREALLNGSIPDHVLTAEGKYILNDYFWKNLILDETAFQMQLSYALTFANEDSLNQIMDIDGDLANRILHYRSEFTDWVSFCELLKTKNYTYTRISRALTHLLLKQTDELRELARDCDYSPYAHILGFQKERSDVIKLIRAHSSIPVDTGLNKLLQGLKDREKTLLSSDIVNSKLYRNAQRNLSKLNIVTEMSRGPVL